MSFIRIKRIKEWTYLYLVENIWTDKGSRQKVLKYYGKVDRGKINPQIVIERDGCCQKCGGKENLTIDHIVPLSLGGENSYKNVWTLCRECNLMKGQGTISEKEKLYNQLQLLILAFSNKYKQENSEWTEDKVRRSIMRRKKIIELTQKLETNYDTLFT
jgi:hypothetical protein